MPKRLSRAWVSCLSNDSLMHANPEDRTRVMTTTTRKSTHRKPFEILLEALVRVAGYSAVVFVALIFIFLMREALPTFNEVSISELFIFILASPFAKM